MATLIIPDNTPVADLEKLALAMGKRLKYQHGPGNKPKPEDVPHGHNRRPAHCQPIHSLADR